MIFSVFRWMFGALGCTLGGFMMFWTGSTSVYILAALSHGHYQALRNQLMGHQPPSVRQCYLKVIGCMLLALVWTVMPIFGWSRYSFEGIGTSCSIEWNENSFNVFSYNITILVTIFCIPLFFMGYFNFKLIRVVRFIKVSFRDFD